VKGEGGALKGGVRDWEIQNGRCPCRDGEERFKSQISAHLRNEVNIELGGGKRGVQRSGASEMNGGEEIDFTEHAALGSSKRY